MKTHEENTRMNSNWLVAAVLGMACAALPLAASAQGYRVTNLVSDLPGVAAHTDPQLINAWGLDITFGGTLIVGANETSQAAFYRPDGTPRGVTIGVNENPTGLVLNRFHHQFLLGTGEDVRPSLLIFATEGGKILGWNRDVNNSEAVVAVDNSAHQALYKGAAQARSRHGPRLYAANFRGGQVEVYDGAFQWVGSFTDPHVDAGFSPFNVANIGGLLYVTFAKPTPPELKDDEAGPGHGFVDVFSPEGHLLRRLVSHGPLNSPWGVARAPRHFGRFGGALLVGNFGDGRINAFNPVTGAFLGPLPDAAGNPIVIGGLWALKFHDDFDHDADDNVLYFTAGPDGESHGVIGAITPVRR